MMGRREPLVRGPELRHALDVVAESYLGFLRCGPEPATEDDTRAFTAHHAACRAALAHLEQLVKVARQLGADAPEIEEAAAVLVEARQAIALLDQEACDVAEEEG